MQVDGSGRVHVVQSMPVLRPDEQVLQLMLDGTPQIGTPGGRRGVPQEPCDHPPGRSACPLTPLMGGQYVGS